MLFALVALLVLASCQSADQGKGVGSPNPVVVACINTSDPERRFSDVDELASARSYAAARTILEVLLTDCDAGVRAKALAALKRLDPPDTTPGPETPNRPGADASGGASIASSGNGGDAQHDPPGCPGTAVWTQRFEYADTLGKAQEYAGVRAVLESALDDCSEDVRKRAARDLVKLPFPSPPGCPDKTIWNERFAYADDLKNRDMIQDARAVLSPMLDACNEGVRKQALNGLLALLPQSPASTTACAGYSSWEPRLTYGNRLKKSGDIAGARALLVPALADCDPKVRNMALSMLLHRPSLLERRLAAIGSYIGDAFAAAGDIIFKAGIAVGAAAGLIFLLRLFWRRRPRNDLKIEPLIVSGSGFDGRQFADIVAEMHRRTARVELFRKQIADRLQDGADVASATVAEPRVTLNTLPPMAATISAAAQAIAGENAGKLIAEAVNYIFEPRYLCSGSLVIGTSGGYIVIKVTSRGRPIGGWSYPSTATSLIPDLKSCAIVILTMIADDLRTEQRTP